MAGTNFKLLTYLNNIKLTTALFQKIPFLYGISSDLLLWVCIDNFWNQILKQSRNHLDRKQNSLKVNSRKCTETERRIWKFILHS